MRQDFMLEAVIICSFGLLVMIWRIILCYSMSSSVNVRDKK